MYRPDRPHNNKPGRSFRRRRRLIAVGTLVLVILGGLAITSLDRFAVERVSIPGISRDTDDAASPKPFVSRLAGKQLYVNPNAPAAAQAAAWRATRPADAAQMERLAKLPTARWIGDVEDFTELTKYFSEVKALDKTAVVVLYNIPGRDCGLYSAGGAETVKAYKSFVDGVAGAMGDASGIVIIEPDALAQLEETGPDGKACLTPEKKAQRNDMLSYAVTTLKASPERFVYLDAGNSAWGIDAGVMADRLKAAGVESADGFSLNVSNFRSSDDTTAYGNMLADKLPGKGYVVDTSRNGLGHFTNQDRPGFGWCNPPGRALGHYPTVTTGRDRVDAFLYIKIPGESDGMDADPLKCFGGPPAGQWNPEYALGLVSRWPAELQPKP